MRLFRPALAATAAALAAASGTATAAPPVGCYGLPDYNAVVCVTSFTPTNAIPGVDPDGGSVPVTVPAHCVGTCQPASTVLVPVPGASSGSGSIATVTINGEPWVIGLNGGIPPIPDVDVPPLGGGDCPGEPMLNSVDASPYVCAHESSNWLGGATVYVGTCLTNPCTLETWESPDFGDGIRNIQEFLEGIGQG